MPTPNVDVARIFHLDDATLRDAMPRTRSRAMTSPLTWTIALLAMMASATATATAAAAISERSPPRRRSLHQTQTAYSHAFARDGGRVVIRPSREQKASSLGADPGSTPKVNRTFTVYTCGIPQGTKDEYLPFEPGCRVKLVGCPGGDCTHWPVEHGMEMQETALKGVFSVTTDMYQPGDEFAFAVMKGSCTPWEEEWCVKNMNCGTRGNCEHRYDSGLEFNWSGSEDHPDGDPACYYEERDLEHHTCASMSPLVNASCVDSVYTEQDGFTWHNRIVPSSTDIRYVWGSCEPVPANVNNVCGDNFRKPPCFSMPEVADPPVCDASDLALKTSNFVEPNPAFTQTGHCAGMGACKQAKDRDVLFLVDASASIGGHNFRNNVIPLIQKLYCAAASSTNTRMGVMLFPGFDADTCNGAKLAIPMGRYTADQWMQKTNAIKNECCATATPTAEALMIARDYLKNNEQFGIENSVVYMVSDGAPEMNFGWLDCSNAAADKYKRLSRWTKTVLGTEVDYWTGIDGESSDMCHYKYRYVQLYGMVHQMFGTRVVFIGVPNNVGKAPEPAQFIGGMTPGNCFVNASGQFCKRWAGYGVLSQRTPRTKRHNPDIAARNANGLKPGWVKAREMCDFEVPIFYSFISRPFYANFHSVFRWDDPNVMTRPYELMCDPNPCTDTTLNLPNEHFAICYGDKVSRSGTTWWNSRRCIKDRRNDACRAKYGYNFSSVVDEPVVGGFVDGGTSISTTIECRHKTFSGSFVTDGIATVTCQDLQPCTTAWSN